MLYEVITRRGRPGGGKAAVERVEGRLLKIAARVITSYSIHYTKLYEEGVGNFCALRYNFSY